MIKFEVYPRDAILSLDPAGKVCIDCTYNVHTFEDGELTLCKIPAEVSIVVQQPELTLSKQTPEPLTISNPPPTHINLLAGYDYVPNVEGGVGPFTFSIDGMDDEFTFNSSTGELKRPPQ